MVLGFCTFGVLHVNLIDDALPIILRHSNELQRFDAVERERVVPLVQAPPTSTGVTSRHIDHYDRPRRADLERFDE